LNVESGGWRECGKKEESKKERKEGMSEGTSN
jgi:hypothetical protein